MPFRPLLVACVLMLTSTVHAAERMYVGPTGDPVNVIPRAQVSVEPSPTVLELGDAAPGFSFLATDGRWHRSDELLAKGPILLLFGADSEKMRSIEAMRGTFDDLGVTPVFVLDMRASSAATLGRRHQLTLPIVPDPKCVIGALFNTLDPRDQRNDTSYFVMDVKGRIRALGHGPLPTAPRLLVLAARGLGRPLPPSAWTDAGPDPMHAEEDLQGTR